MNRSRYWTLHAINGLGQHQPFVLEPIQTFLTEQPLVDLKDRQVQAHLVALDTHRHWAHLSLRCFVSAILFFECLDKAHKYGAKHQFTAEELFPLVMDPRPSRDLHHYPMPQGMVSLTTKILDSFEPQRSNLSTYTKICLKGWGDLKAFLLERGLIEVTDWFLLWNRTPSGLARILEEYSFPYSCGSTELPEGVDPASYYTHTPAEISAAVQLLQCFHQVYRQQRQATYRQPYLPPTPQQLEEMGRLLHQDAQTLLQDLKNLAKKLRHYVIYYAPTKAQNQSKWETEDEVTQWLHQHLLPYLNSAVEQVVRHRYRHHTNAKKRAQYKQALDLYFTQNISMGEIGHRFGISQTTISNLLALKTLREDVSVEILIQAPRALLTQLRPFHTPTELEQFNAFINEFVQSMMAEDASQSFTSHNRQLNTPFAQAICQTLPKLEP